MKITYDREVDVLRIIFRDVTIDESDEQKPGLIFDYDKDGNVVGLEMLDASKRITEPESLEFALASGKSAPAFIREKPNEKYGK
jgi:uncharacterized protein YuzE